MSMKVKARTKISDGKKQLTIRIPKIIREELNIQAGDYLHWFIIDNNKIIIDINRQEETTIQ